MRSLYDTGEASASGRDLLASAYCLLITRRIGTAAASANPTQAVVTPTVDYAILLDGDLWLELDDGATVHLSAGDIVVQQATRHGWRNKGERPATLAFVMLGAVPALSA